jgi:hypothetical protein
MWKCNLVFLAWKPFVLSNNLSGWQSFLESTLNPISLTVLHSKHMPLFVIFKITTNRFTTAERMRITKTKWLSGPLNLFQIWHGQCCCTHHHTGKITLMLRFGEWQSSMKFTCLIICQMNKICVQLTSLWESQFRDIDLLHFMFGDIRCTF